MTRVESSVARSPLVGAAGMTTSTDPARLSDVAAEVSPATPGQQQTAQTDVEQAPHDAELRP